MKTKVLDIFNTDKKCLIKNNIESSPQEIWIRIRFLEISGYPSLLLRLKNHPTPHEFPLPPFKNIYCLFRNKSDAKIYNVLNSQIQNK